MRAQRGYGTRARGNECVDRSRTRQQPVPSHRPASLGRGSGGSERGPLVPAVVDEAFHRPRSVFHHGDGTLEHCWSDTRRSTGGADAASRFGRDPGDRGARRARRCRWVGAGSSARSTRRSLLGASSAWSRNWPATCSISWWRSTARPCGGRSLATAARIRCIGLRHGWPSEESS